MLIACDIDGTIDSDPQVFQTLCAALRSAGCQVAVLTGCHGAAQITPADVEAKQEYLQQIGFTAFDQLAVFPDGKDLPQAKAQWCKDHGVAALIDNDRGNAEAAAAVCLVLVPWGTRVGKAKDGVAKSVLRIVEKYSDDQPRDDDGRWGGGGSGATVAHAQDDAGTKIREGDQITSSKHSGEVASASAQSMASPGTVRLTGGQEVPLSDVHSVNGTDLAYRL